MSTEKQPLSRPSAQSQPDQSGTRETSSNRSSLFSLEDQFEFYGQYHANPTNVILHIVCVPLIFFTTLILVHALAGFEYTDLSAVVGGVQLPGILMRTGFYGPPGTVYELNLSTLASLGYAAYFVALEPVAGLLYAPVLISLGHWSNLIPAAYPHTYLTPTLAVFVLAWAFQLIGHARFERRAPALVDNLFQSLVLAVFFVWMEILFSLGYRKDLHFRLSKKISLAIAKYKASQKS